MSNPSPPKNSKPKRSHSLYAGIKRYSKPQEQQQQNDQRLLGLIKHSWLQSSSVYGYRQIHDEPREVARVAATIGSGRGLLKNGWIAPDFLASHGFPQEWEPIGIGALSGCERDTGGQW